MFAQGIGALITAPMRDVGVATVGGYLHIHELLIGMLMSFNMLHTLLNSTKTLGKINNAFIEIN